MGRRFLYFIGRRACSQWYFLFLPLWFEPHHQGHSWFKVMDSLWTPCELNYYLLTSANIYRLEKKLYSVRLGCGFRFPFPNSVCPWEIRAIVWYIRVGQVQEDGSSGTWCCGEKNKAAHWLAFDCLQRKISSQLGRFHQDLQLSQTLKGLVFRNCILFSSSMSEKQMYEFNLQAYG